MRFDEERLSICLPVALVEQAPLRLLSLQGFVIRFFALSVKVVSYRRVCRGRLSMDAQGIGLIREQRYVRLPCGR